MMLDEQLRLASIEFNQAGTIDPAVIPEDLHPDRMPENFCEGLFVFQTALLMNMAKTCRHTVDQIHTCLEIAKVAQFYADDVSRNRRLFLNNGALNNEILRVSRNLCSQAFTNAQGFLGNAYEIFKEGKMQIESPRFAELKYCDEDVKLLAKLVDRERAQADVYIDLRGRGQTSIFPANYKPTMPDGQGADEVIQSLYAQNATSLNDAINNTQDTLRLMLARAFYIRAVVMPAAPVAAPKWEEDITFNRGFVGAVNGWSLYLEELCQKSARMALLEQKP